MERISMVDSQKRMEQKYIDLIQSQSFVMNVSKGLNKFQSLYMIYDEEFKLLACNTV
jgi:hypothetical protein